MTGEYQAIFEYLTSRQEFLDKRPDAYASVHNARYFQSVIVQEYGIEEGVPFVASTEINEDKLKDVVTQASYDIDAFNYLLSIGEKYSSKSEILSKFIYDVAVRKITSPKRSRGRDPRNTYARNFVITLAVQRAIEMGMPAYAGGNNKKETACALVEKILRECFGVNCNVTEIWKKRQLK